MVRGFAAALDDPTILVQRGVLDLLTSTLKLDSKGFKWFVPASLCANASAYDLCLDSSSTRRADQILLMRAITGVVLRRDLSLSRRLYTWLLGASDDSETQIAHLREHGLDLLHSALKVRGETRLTYILHAHSFLK
jgi:hypothetical protein